MDIDHIAGNFGVTITPLQNEIHYLGYNIKPCNYRNQDWRWLIDKYKQKLMKWTHKFLSLGGKYILVQAVLQQIYVYWAQLFWIPNTIVKKVTSIMTNFLWRELNVTSKMNLCKWSELTKPKKIGGWGLLQHQSFGTTLLTKTFWRAITGKGIWQDIVHSKYLQNNTLEDIYKNTWPLRKEG